MGVIVTSGRPLRQALPDGAQFWSKPWAPLDVIREAERMAHAMGHEGATRQAPPRPDADRARSGCTRADAP